MLVIQDYAVVRYDNYIKSHGNYFSFQAV